MIERSTYEMMDAEIDMQRARIAELEAENERLKQEIAATQEKLIRANDELIQRNSKGLASIGAVKVLEWEEISDHEPGWWAAQDDNLPLGYEVRINSRDIVRVRFPGKAWETFDGNTDAAKSAAQADYEHRILSALEPVAPESQQEAARIGDAVLAWMTKYDLLDGEQEYYVADVIAVLDDLTPLTRPAEQAVTKAGAVRREIKSEMEILRRLADGDQIAFSEDGDCAFFTGGDRAFVGPVIISMRSKSYLKRITLDDENYRGTAERDVISDAGIAALKAAMEASHD